MKDSETVAKRAVVLNKTYVERAGVGENRDERTPGFCLRVTERGKRTFFVNARISGTRLNKTKKIGNYPDLLCDQARDQAIEVLRSLHKEVDPDALLRAESQAKRKLDEERKAAAVTLGAALERYMETKAAKHSDQTKRVYRSQMKHFSDWIDLPITSISRNMCEARFREITQPASANRGGPGAANLAFTFLKARL